MSLRRPLRVPGNGEIDATRSYGLGVCALSCLIMVYVYGTVRLSPDTHPQGSKTLELCGLRGVNLPPSSPIRTGSLRSILFKKRVAAPTSTLRLVVRRRRLGPSKTRACCPAPAPAARLRSAPANQSQPPRPSREGSTDSRRTRETVSSSGIRHSAARTYGGDDHQTERSCMR